VGDVTAYCTGLALATAAGLNAWVPLLAVGLLARWTDLVDVGGEWSRLAETPVLVGLAAVVAADFAGDKVPAPDHVLHLAGTVIAPATGVLAALASASALDVSPAVLTVVGPSRPRRPTAPAWPSAPSRPRRRPGPAIPCCRSSRTPGRSGSASSALALPVLAALLALALLGTAWRAARRLRRGRPRPRRA
jgi:hypothetical protein